MVTDKRNMTRLASIRTRSHHIRIATYAFHQWNQGRRLCRHGCLVQKHNREVHDVKSSRCRRNTCSAYLKTLLGQQRVKNVLRTTSAFFTMLCNISCSMAYILLRTANICRSSDACFICNFSYFFCAFASEVALAKALETAEAISRIRPSSFFSSFTIGANTFCKGCISIW